MSIFEIFFLAVGLSMDAFAVSIGKGITIKKIKLKHILSIALIFGFFQAIMPLIGYFFGIYFRDFFIKIDHFVAFFLLSYIGIEMIKNAFSKSKRVESNNNQQYSSLIMMGIATSIDALVVGLTFAFLKVNIILATVIIGFITFIICLVGVLIGYKIGEIYGKISEIFGGSILILLGIKILITHLFLL